MTIDNKELPVHITYKQNKHTYFRVNHKGLEVYASKGIPKHIIEAHIKNQFHIFYDKYEKYLKANQSFSLWGNPLNVIFNVGKPSYNLQSTSIVIQHQTLEKGIKYVLKEEMKAYLTTHELKINAHLKAHDIKPRKYRLKYYKSKFGAYHKIHDVIYLNIYLATQKHKHVWYVLMHEYAHTKHFHHQKSFYDFLQQLHPDYRVIEKALKSLVIPTYFNV
jgi:predicted metal-dependent hydrolase